MKLYEIVLPLYTNSGDDCDEAHEAWRRKALDVAGRFTECPDAHGFWEDGGKLYNERVRPYHVICTESQWAILLDAAFGLFPGQLAICHACLGVAKIEPRNEWHARF